MRWYKVREFTTSRPHYTTRAFSAARPQEQEWGIWGGYGEEEAADNPTIRGTLETLKTRNQPHYLYLKPSRRFQKSSSTIFRLIRRSSFSPSELSGTQNLSRGTRLSARVFMQMSSSDLNIFFYCSLNKIAFSPSAFELKILLSNIMCYFTTGVSKIRFKDRAIFHKWNQTRAGKRRLTDSYLAANRPVR